MKKLLAMLLCLAMMLSLAACVETPVESTDPTVTTSADEVARDMYATARAALDGATDVSLELVITTLMDMDGDEFSQQSTQKLTYQAIGTADAIIAKEEALEFSVHSAEAEEDEDSEPSKFTEIWAKDQLYIQMQDQYRYYGDMTAEEAAAYFVPVVLLDAALYGAMTYETDETGTKLTFTEPTAAESWAMPAEAELVSASGSAQLDDMGVLTQMDYTVSYTYGPASYTVTVQSKPLAAAEVVSVPENTGKYQKLADVEAVHLFLSSLANLSQADAIAFTSAESLMSEAAGYLQNSSVQMYMHGRKEQTIFKSTGDYYTMNYSTGESNEEKLEETFIDGVLTSVYNDGLPSTGTGVTWEDIRTYAGGVLLGDVAAMDFWQDITITDLGTVLLMEFTLNENFGNTTQNTICESLWGDSAFLINLSSDYKNADLTGYLSVDKFTGVAVAAGYYYKGIHTIEGHEFALTLQYDQSMEAPAKGAYKEITGEMPAEQEPENKAKPLFYHVTGADGQEMWLLGTIHVGDERTAYLPQEIKDAFAASDALALECNSELFDQQLEEDDELASQVSNLYFYSDGKEMKDRMEQEDYDIALKLLKAVGGYNMNMPYAKPYLWSNTIELFYMRQGYQLHGDQGVEERLTAWAKEQGKEIREVESSMAQLQMLTGFSTDLQIWMLTDMVYYNGQDYWKETADLYELWCAGDEAAMREELSDEWDTSEMTEEEIAQYTPLMEEYAKAMDTDRNEGMLKVAIDYLESGDVVFYAVGLAHLLNGTNGLVDALRAEGYTVELVTYAE